MLKYTILTIPEPTNVKMVLYNNYGEEVGTLMNEAKSKGIYSFTFSAKEYNSGLYYYYTIVGNTVKTGKILLSK